MAPLSDEFRWRIQQREAWMEYLETILWHHYATLTFAEPITERGANWVFNQFIRRLERKGHGRVWWCYVPELGWAGKRLHLHALLGGTALIPSRAVEEDWWAGIAKVTRYDPERRAIHYITKNLRRGESEPELSAYVKHLGKTEHPRSQ